MKEAELLKMLRANPDLTLVTDGEYTTVAPRQVTRLSERDLQAAVVAECDRRALTQPAYGLLLAIPNGQYRQGQRIEPGLRAGVPDLLLPVPSGQWHGLWLELKCGHNKPSREQLEWIRRLRAQAYRCEIVYDTVDAVMTIIDNYLEGL